MLIDIFAHINYRNKNAVTAEKIRIDKNNFKQMKLRELITIVCGLTLALSSCKKDNNTTSSVVKDVDGNVYKTVTIGTQTWMVENLKTTKYNDSTPIPIVTDGLDWKLSSAAYFNYNNIASNAITYGRLYNWYAVNTGKLAPKGWHVPSIAEWDTLQTYLIANGYNYDGSTTGNYIAKSMASKTGWDSSTSAGCIGNNPNTNNKSGFTALPGGYRYYDGSFYHVGFESYWWSTTESYSNAYFMCLSNHTSSLYYHTDFKRSGFSVRCIKD